MVILQQAAGIVNFFFPVAHFCRHAAAQVPLGAVGFQNLRHGAEKRRIGGGKPRCNILVHGAFSDTEPFRRLPHRCARCGNVFAHRHGALEYITVIHRMYSPPKNVYAAAARGIRKRANKGCPCREKS